MITDFSYSWTMRLIFPLLASLACTGLARREQSEEPLQNRPLRKNQGVSVHPLNAFATLLLASNPSDAFNTPSLQVRAPVRRPRTVFKRPVLMQDPYERRIDRTDGGMFTKAEFKEYYGDSFEKEWANAAPAVENVSPDRIRRLSELRCGEEVIATVTGLTTFGAFCDIGADAEALLHVTEISDSFIPDIRHELRLGDEVQAWIKNVDVKGNRVRLTAQDQSYRKQLEDLNVGDTVEATVTFIKPFGAFCDIGATQEAFLPVSDICDEFIEDPHEKISQGQRLTARIRYIDLDDQKLKITCRDLPSGERAEPVITVDANRTPLESLQVGEEFQATVKAVTDFGAFVDIGARKDALLHKSEISDQFVENVADVLAVDDIITVRIKDVHLGSQRFSVSSKGLDAS